MELRGGLRVFISSQLHVVLVVLMMMLMMMIIMPVVNCVVDVDDRFTDRLPSYSDIAGLFITNAINRKVS